jgi:hypothetical protein
MAKYEPKTKPTAVNVDEFIEAVPDPRWREEALAVDAMLRRVSGEEPTMWGPSIVGYGSYHYRYDSGHEGDAPRIGFSPRKAQLVLYLMGFYGDRQSEADALFASLGKHSLGKSCLYIPRLDKVDMKILERLSTMSWEAMARTYPA